MNVPDGEFYQALGRLEAKLDQLIKGDDDKEDRIRVLESWRWKVLGAATTVSVLVGIMVQLLFRRY